MVVCGGKKYIYVSVCIHICIYKHIMYTYSYISTWVLLELHNSHWKQSKSICATRSIIKHVLKERISSDMDVLGIVMCGIVGLLLWYIVTRQNSWAKKNVEGRKTMQTRAKLQGN